MKRFLNYLGMCSFVAVLLFTGQAMLIQKAEAAKKSTESSSQENKLMHWGADRSVVNRKTRIVELRGNAFLNRDNEEMHADEIDLNLETQFVVARGRVQYQFGTYLVKADQVEVDLKNKTGTITNGNLTNGTFALRGGRLEQVGENRFLVKNFDYTTCIDCPNSWQMTGREADLTIEGYAYIKDFVFKIKDASLAWLPYMILPMKTKRQSGLLFPRFGFNDVYGVYTVLPYYLAPNDWSDMTFGAGYYSNRGERAEVEGRYALTDRSQGQINFFWTRDSEIPDLRYRYAGKIGLTQELPLGFEGKLRVNEVSDSGYPITYSDDIMGRYEPVLSSDLFFSRNDPEISSVISFRRLRNLLYFDDENKPRSGLDGLTVQEFPRVTLNTNDQFLFGGKVAAGVETRFNRFTRGAEPVDYLTPQGTSGLATIREANRFTMIPNFYTTLNPWPWLMLTPSVQYRAFFYNFNNAYDNLARGYLLTQLDMSLQLEKNIATSTPGISYKHTIRPTLTYSNLPIIQESNPDHPFIRQVQDQIRPGQYFDNWDVVPIGTSQSLDTYNTPIGNSLTYGLITQLFKKDNTDPAHPVISKRFEAKVNQTFDIREAKRFFESGQKDNRVILSPLFTQLWYGDDNLNWSVEYTYYSYLDRYQDALFVNNPSPHRFSSTVYWNFESGVHDGVLLFDRSLALNYSYSRLTSKVSSLRAELHFSINDYIIPSVSYSLDLFSDPKQVLDSRYGVIFQSPSRCWRVEAAITRSIDRGTAFVSSFALNLTGNSLDDQLRK
jgi:lipopolysaccharide assembly outer membrane protein LptD (OstA)